MNRIFLTCVCLLLVSPATAQTPPFSGTIFLDPDIVTPADPSTFMDVTSTGRGMRTMFDRRVNNWITTNAYLFFAQFDDGLSAEIQVNPEFGSEAESLAQAERFAPFIGQLPTALRRDLQTVWIHRGVQPFGGGNNNILIHTGQADEYLRDGILEETLIHEATHTSLDGRYASTPEWQAAQAADQNFISTYARDFPNREDMAESFLLYLAIRFRSDRISPQLASSINITMPNRIEYFESLNLIMHPYSNTVTGSEANNEAISVSPILHDAYPNPFQSSALLSFDLSRPTSIRLTILDLLGRDVAMLASGPRPAGRFEERWVPSRHASGVYVVRLETETGVQTKLLVYKR